MATLESLRTLSERYTASEQAAYDEIQPVLHDDAYPVVVKHISDILHERCQTGDATFLELTFSYNHPKIGLCVFSRHGEHEHQEVLPDAIAEWWDDLFDTRKRLIERRKEVFHALIERIGVEWAKRSDVPVEYYQGLLDGTSSVLEFDWSVKEESKAKRAKIDDGV